MRWRRAAGAAAIVVAPLSVAKAETELDLGTIEDVESLALDELLEQPVTSASHYAQKPGDSPTLVSTLDGDIIERFGYRTLRDALRGLRGVYTSNDRNYSYLGARGFSIPGDYNTRFSLTINNHRVNDPIYGQATPGAELGLPMIAIERVELIRGGAWSVQGENALLVQVVTATGASRPGLRVTASSLATAATYDDPAGRPAMEPRGQDVAASYGAAEGKLDVFVAGSYSFDPGLSALYMPELAVADEPCFGRGGVPRPCDGVITGNDAEEVGSFFGSLRAGNLILQTLTSRRRKRVPTAAFGTAIGDAVTTFDDRLYADLEYKRQGETTELVARVGGDYFSYRGTYPYAGVDPYTNFDEGTATWWSGELRGRYKIGDVGPYLTGVEVAAGIESRLASARQVAGDQTADGYVPLFDRTDHPRKVSLFGHATGRAFEHVVGFAAIRADYHPDSFGLSVNPQGGLVLDGGDLGRIRASIARGFRAPNVYEQYAGATITPESASVLGPERSETRELSIERYFGEHVRLLVVGFRQDVTDLIGLTAAADGTATYENQGGMRSYGVETELEGRWDKLRFRASYTRYRARTLDETTPANSPASLANVMLLAPIAGGKADVGVESYYVNKRLAFNGTEIPALFTTNLVLTVHDVADSLDLSLGIQNLFDERSGDPSGEEHRQSIIPHDPRTVWLRLSLALEPCVRHVVAIACMLTLSTSAVRAGTARKIDRHRVLQIVVNLISNARDAVRDVAGPRTVHIAATLDDDHLVIRVTDTGVGIPAEIVERIFSAGFTSKADGHGYGLHSSALAARELHGSLEVASAGHDRGATFTLRVPLHEVSS